MVEHYPLDAAMRAQIDEQRRLYLETDGRVGGLVEQPGLPPAPVLLLTTTGRRSGEPRTTPLVYARDGERFLIVASLGGYDHHPQWYLNLLEEPAAAIQVGAERIAVRAEVAAADRERLWAIVSDGYPTYLEYQQATEREIPVVVLRPEPPAGG